MPTKRRYLSPREQADLIEKQGGKCACKCGETLVIGKIRFDHIKPLWMAQTEEEARRLNRADNFQALTIGHHQVKTDEEATRRAKADRCRARNDGTYLNAKQRELQRILSRTKQIHDPPASPSPSAGAAPSGLAHTDQASPDGATTLERK